MGYKFNICDEFDCNRGYCLKLNGYDCQEKFDVPECIFYGEHIILNVENEGAKGK